MQFHSHRQSTQRKEEMKPPRMNALEWFGAIVLTLPIYIFIWVLIRTVWHWVTHD
jgi:hypothetical protein